MATKTIETIFNLQNEIKELQNENKRRIEAVKQNNKAFNDRLNAKDVTDLKTKYNNLMQCKGVEFPYNYDFVKDVIYKFEKDIEALRNKAGLIPLSKVKTFINKIWQEQNKLKREEIKQKKSQVKEEKASLKDSNAKAKQNKLQDLVQCGILTLEEAKMFGLKA